MHREVGFIRMDPETKKVAFISAQNTGEWDHMNCTLLTEETIASYS